ncbi:AAA family ATPase [Nitratiruptor sp. SB155-2]|uniref:AAA family ATPase n=1 Tax=Nitratiruptor sp. (strain SB155-2) TaxID=387092 RepID=UPI0001586DB2|nr:ATP-binding protein [Nitratiruptor sp. SB155-2]BAF69401.1 ATPase, AAA family [Nitratiruptor sp. SB155-2]
MELLRDFIETKKVEKSKIFPHLKCSAEEAKILQLLTKKYISGVDEVNVYDLLSELYGEDSYVYLEKLGLIKKLFDLGWLVQGGFGALKSNDYTKLELLHTDVALSVPFLRLLEEGNVELALPDIKPYNDHLDYFQDQFFRIELYQKIVQARQNYSTDAPTINRLKNKINLLETRIQERLQVTKNEIVVEELFKEYELSPKERIIFLALLKEEYAGTEGGLREMNALIDLISFNEYERIENRTLLEESSKLVSSGLIDYDEILTPFGGLSRSFFIVEDVMQRIIHPDKKRNKKMKLQNLIKDQDIFELIEPKTTLDDVVLHPQTRKTLDSLLNQMDKRVAERLKKWGIKPKRKGIDARIIFYGPPGTGKTLTALSLAKSLKKQVLSFDCSKILSMYVGESEKNVRKIFDTYKELSSKAKTEPVLLLNEADQFLSARTQGPGSSADKMHNQMQNIFLEQIENFEGVLIATTNLLETIDPAFSRRFNYKIEFKKPNFKERVRLWEMMLPKNAEFEKGFDVEKLASYELTGGQINLIIKNTAYKVAIKEEPIFTLKDFVEEIEKEKVSAFGDEKSLGFLK